MVWFVRPSKNFVNLGGLYHFGPFKKCMAGWAYFEDGSMFIVPGCDVQHEIFEVRMKVAAHLVSHPGVLHAQFRRPKDTGNGRVVIVSKASKKMPKKEMIVSARSAVDGERIISLDKPFLQFSFELNNTRERVPFIKFRAKDERIVYEKSKMKEALHTFRGTLIDGTLQPNVRLGNGLALRGTHDVGLKAESKSQFPQAEEPARSERPAQTEGPAQNERPIDRDMSKLASMELALQAKERELALREELLQWKQKTFRLKQKMAKKSLGNRRERPRTMSETADSGDYLPGSESSKNNTRPQTKQRYSDGPGYGSDSRYSADNSLLQSRPKNREKSSYASHSQHPVDDSAAAPISDYKVRIDEGASPSNAQLPLDADTQIERHAPPALATAATRPTDSFDEEKPSANEDSVRNSTSDMSASSLLGTVTSAPPALDRLRTLIADLDKMDRGDKPTRRRRSRHSR